jgi:hypothetical protein
MQHGFVQRICRKRSADVWQFRWSETGPDGKRTHIKKSLGQSSNSPMNIVPGEPWSR